MSAALLVAAALALLALLAFAAVDLRRAVRGPARITTATTTLHAAHHEETTP